MENENMVYKPAKYGGGSSNIRKCPVCKKYQHFIRYHNSNQDKCMVCGHWEDRDDNL